MKDQKLHEYLYNIENWVDEFAIVALSFGAIFVTVWSFFVAPGETPGMITFGRNIEPWITMLALMLIARELWLMNRHNMKQAYGEGE